jgi:hypothetical protein
VDSITSLTVNGVSTNANLGLMPSHVVFASPPASGAVVAWSGTWYFLCRFTKDTFEFVHEGYGVWSLQGLEFKSLIA